MMRGAIPSIIAILAIALVSINIFILVTGSYINDYWNQRNQFIADEQQMQTGGDLQLTSKEEIVNQYLLSAKLAEYEKGVKNQTLFLSSQNFLTVQPLIEQSLVFKTIQKMPKGAVLHAHDSALVSEDFVFNLTFMEHLYFCNNSEGLIRFKFSREVPTETVAELKLRKKFVGDCEWKLLSDVRNNEINQLIRSKLTIKGQVYLNGDLAWEKFEDVFATVIPLVTYKSALEKYWYQAFLENYQDNIMYMEIRGTLPITYDLDGKIYDEVQVAGMYYKILQQFKRDFPKFHGARFIYGPYRRCDNKTVDDYISIYKRLIKNYPDFIAGFDLVGQEDQGLPLTDFVQKLLTFPKDTKFFFHAGETNWYGMTDLNLVDAVLLGAYRVGHGYALYKHPLVLQKIKEEKIAIEVCPISNQVLGLVQDLRNHPAAGLIAANYPVVIAADDPSFWGAKGLSYDFYSAYMAFTNKNAGISILKQLALNSIIYSAMPMDEQGKAIVKFHQLWDEFIGVMLTDRDFNSLNEIP